MFKGFVVLLMHEQLHLNDPPLPVVTQKIMLHVPATTYEPSEDSVWGITNPSVSIKLADFSNITSIIPRGTFSILQSLADSDKPCLNEHWLEYSSTNSSLSLMVAFFNMPTFLSLYFATS